MIGETIRERIANVGAGVTPTYHATESVEEAKAVVEQCMSATERLRKLLDERGVEWDYDTATDTVTWLNGLHWMHATELQHGMLDADMVLTPEQAVEATLGPSDPRKHGLIPHFWTGDETLHIDLGKLPGRIDVTLPDPRGREVYSAKVHRFEPERGMCENDSLKRGAGVFVCSECGAYLDITDMSEEDVDVFYEPKYCPDCGAKVIDA